MINSSTETRPFVVDRQSTKKIIAFGDEILIHVSSSMTGGQFSIIEQSYDKSEWGWEHLHQREDHFVQIVQGEMEFDLEGTVHQCVVGQSIFIPKKTWHKFRTISSQKAIMLFFNFPGGLEEMFMEIADTERDGVKSDEDYLAIAGSFGVHIRQ